MLLVLSVTQLTGWGTIYYGFSLFVDPLQQSLGWSRAWIQGAPTAAFLAWGAAAPIVGHLLNRVGSRTVMTTGSTLATVALTVWATWPGHAGVFLAVWIVLGIAMAMVLYEPAFATLVAIAPDRYQRAITLLTLVGGFASTLFMPLVQWSIDAWGWQAALYAMAAANGLICLPLHRLGLPAPPASSPDANPPTRQEAPLLPTRDLFHNDAFDAQTFAGLAIWFAAFQAATAALTFLLVPLLTSLDVPMPTVLLCVAAIGPMQVVGRALLFTLRVPASAPRRSAGVLVLTPVALLVLIGCPPQMPWLLVFAALYGTSKGMMTIIRGTAVADHMSASIYAPTNGWLSMVGRGAKALSPVAIAALWEATGSPSVVLWTTLVLSGLAFVGLAVVYTER